MIDIVERLRTMQALEHDADAVLEAADEIERLRQQVQDLQLELASYRPDEAKAEEK